MSKLADHNTLAVVDDMLRATNAHDIDSLVACFADDYVSQWPQHPARSFSGTEQVHRNWSQMFCAVPDLAAEVITRSSGPSGSSAATASTGNRSCCGAPSSS